MATGAGAYNIVLPEESFRKAMAKFLMQEAAAKRGIKPSTPLGMNLQGAAGLAERALLEYDLKKEREERAANRGMINDPANQPPGTVAAPPAAPPTAQSAVPRPPAPIPAAPPAASPVAGRRAYDDEGPQAEFRLPGPSTQRPFGQGNMPVIPGAYYPVTPNLVPGRANALDAPPLPAAGGPAAPSPEPPPARTPAPRSAADDPVRAASYAPEGGGGADYSPAEEAALRTIVAEAPSSDPEAMRAVAAVMANRARGSGGDLQSVVSRPRQFEGYGNRDYQAAAPGTPQFERARQTSIRMLRGEEEDPTGGADHFYSPGAQGSLRAQERAAGGPGRAAVPSWARGQEPVGQFGGNQFYRLGNFPGARRDAAPAGDRQQTDAPVGQGMPPPDAVWPQPPVGGYGAPAQPPPMQRPFMPGTGAPPMMPPPGGPPPVGPGQLSPFRDRFQGDAPGPQSMLDGGGQQAALPFAGTDGGRTSPASSVGSIPGMPGNDPNAVSLRPSMDVPMPEPPGPEPGVFGDPPGKDAIWPPPGPAGAPGMVAQALTAPQPQAAPRPPAPVSGPIPAAGRASPPTAGQGAIPGAPTAAPQAGVLAPPGGGGLMSPTPLVPPQAAPPPPPAPQGGARPPPAGGFPGLVTPPQGSNIPQFIGTPEPRPAAGQVPGPVLMPMPDYVKRLYGQLTAAARAGNEEAGDLAVQLRAPYVQPHPYEVKEVEGKMYAVHPFTRATTEIAGGKHRPDIERDYGTHTLVYDAYHKGLIGIVPKNQGEVKRQQTVGEEQGKAQQALPETMANASRAGTILDEIEAHPGRDSSIGWKSRLPVIEGSTQFAFRKRLEEGMNQAQALALESLRGLGQATEKEREAIASARSRIHPGLNGPELTQAIHEFKRVLQSSIDSARSRAGFPPVPIPSLQTPPRQSELPQLVPGVTRYNGKLYISGDPNIPGNWRAD